MPIHHHEIDRYADRDSLLHRWEPRSKLIALGVLIAVMAALFTLRGALLGMAVAVAILLASRLPLAFLLRRFLELQAFLLLFLIILPLLGSGPVLATLGPLSIHSAGLHAALLIYLKALTIVALSLVLVNSARLTDTLWAAEKLRIPRGLVQLALITLRYLPILLDEKDATTTAAACRAFRMRPNSHSYHTAANIAGSVLVRSYLRANRVWQAMQCRGFQGRLFPVRRWRFTKHDVALSTITGIIAVVILILDFAVWKTNA